MTNIRDVVTEVFLHELAHKVCAIALNVNALFGNGHQNFQVICALTAAAQQVKFASELGAGGRNPVEPTAVEHAYSVLRELPRDVQASARER